MTELHLANWPKAIGLLADGLSGLPESYKRDRAWYGSCLVKTHTEAGHAAAAVLVSLPIVADAVAGCVHGGGYKFPQPVGVAS